MKIYQLHECGGEWEDRYDIIIGSYLRKERAEEEKSKAEAKEIELIKHSKRCNACPFLEEESFLSLDKLNSLYPDYCEKMRLEESCYGIGCENFYIKWDESYFKIVEVEVEE